MCGIAGFISGNKKYDHEKIVARMLGLLDHRGPDQAGLETYGNVCMGMTRLSIIDKANHGIPYEDMSGKYSIVYNGEIYNHDSIRRSLSGKYSFKTTSDAETALYNYLERREKSFNDYNGMYAFALHDMILRTTHIVRDRAGEKPLYYTAGKDFFAFASEIKCLLEVVKPVFNDSDISYRAYEFSAGPETLFKGIYCLEPGECLKVGANGNYTKRAYWKIWDNLVTIKDDKKKILKDLSELIEDSILMRTKNCVHQYGCFISGGVDSSLIACISKPDFIYTAQYDYNDFDELKYARLVAKKIGRELIVVRPGKQDFLRTRDAIAYHLDSPCTWTSFSIWMLLERAKKDLRVILSGEGPDEIFAGYHRYHLLHHDEQIHSLEAMKQYSYLIDKYYGSPTERYARLVNRCDNHFDEEINEYLKNSIQFFFGKMGDDIIHGMGLNDFYTTMQVLLQMADRLCMAFSIENRSPFLDYRLIQFGFSMPSKYKIRNGITKWALKEVARKFIPKEIVERVDKRGFSAPVNKWFEWDKNGRYDRTAYKNLVFEDWKKVFKVKGT